jgi:hypothetical protein
LILGRSILQDRMMERKVIYHCLFPLILLRLRLSGGGVVVARSSLGTMSCLINEILWDQR